uniref:Cytochrome b5 heme-binding domain-containing protein n=1 Tax=Arcella intermedia TaxID=1963864 RepID=A0A6B2LJM8_9EUKA
MKDQLQKGKTCILLDHKIYDVTEYMSHHPGSATLLRAWNGQDCTGIWKSVPHSERAARILERHCIGTAEPQAGAPGQCAECGDVQDRTTRADPHSAHEARAAFHFFQSMVSHPKFPCIGAKMALQRTTYAFRLYDALPSASALARTSEDLLAFLARLEAQWQRGEHFNTFICAFAAPASGRYPCFVRLLC